MIFMEQEVKQVVQEVVAVDNKDKSARIPVLLRLDNPKHRMVYNILESADNKSAYIREAVIYYHRHKDISPEEDDGSHPVGGPGMQSTAFNRTRQEDRK